MNTNRHDYASGVCCCPAVTYAYAPLLRRTTSLVFRSAVAGSVASRQSGGGGGTGTGAITATAPGGIPMVSPSTSTTHKV